MRKIFAKVNVAAAAGALLLSAAAAQAAQSAFPDFGPHESLDQGNARKTAFLRKLEIRRSFTAGLNFCPGYAALFA
jgi:hypothetical protein